MEHSAASPDLLVRPWRRATLVATTIAGLELVLLIVAAFVLMGKSLAPDVKSAARQEALAAPRTPKAAVAPTKRAKPKHAAARKVVPMRPRAKTAVVVLNGNGVQGAAADAAGVVRARGYPVKDVANAPRTGYPRWLVMYRPGFRREASRFAGDLNVKVVTALDGMKPAQLHGAQLLLILGDAR